MGNVVYYLRTAEKVSGRSLIILQFRYRGIKFQYSTGENIDPDDWNKKKQRVKNNKQTTKDGEHSINDLLDSLEEVLLTTYRKELKNGAPAKSVLKEALDNFVNQNIHKAEGPTFHKLLDRFISGEIKHKGKEKSNNTIKTYNTFKGHLLAFEKVKKYPVDYNNIDLAFLYKYITFLRSESTATQASLYNDDKIKETLLSLPIGQNSIAKDVQILKTVLKKGFTLGESKNIWFEHEDFTAAREETDAVYLTDKEILKLYHHDFTNNKRLEGIRDLFVFGCYVGLRYSDYSTVKPENIVEIENEEGEKRLFIKMITKKTGDLVVIPCNPIVKQIFEKYNRNPNKLPKAPENQPFNRTIKEVCKEAGFTEKGRLATEPDLELWESISSHTARRSFCTNLYIQGFPVIDLMKISGHRTEKAFYKYIKLSKLESAQRLDKHLTKVWSSFLLKVA